MSGGRANWDAATTKTFLDICLEQKNLCNFNNKGPTSRGWQNIYSKMKECGIPWDKKQTQNKLTSMRKQYFDWLNLQSHTGLGRDSSTGSIAADDSFWENTEAGQSPVPENRGKPPAFVDQLSELYGRTPQDRGTLLVAGGVTPSIGSDESPRTKSSPVRGGSFAGSGSKRSSRDMEVESPHKKSARLEEAIVDISNTVKARSDKRAEKREVSHQEEMDLVHQLLQNDGIEEGSETFNQAFFLCQKSVPRSQFLTLKTPEGRLRWIEFNWPLHRPKVV